MVVCFLSGEARVCLAEPLERAARSTPTCVGWVWLVRCHRKRNEGRGVPSPTGSGSQQLRRLGEPPRWIGFMKEFAGFQTPLHRADMSQLLPSPVLAPPNQSHRLGCALLTAEGRAEVSG